MKVCSLLVGFVLLASNAPLWAREDIAVAVSMRDSGYTIGDLIKQRVIITLPNGQKISEESLPIKGRIYSWLDLRNVTTNKQGESFVVDFTWQVFATVEIAQKLKTPSILLKTSGVPEKAIAIPSQEFHYSPVFAHPLELTKRKGELPPIKFTESIPLVLMLIFGVVGVFLGILWLWLNDRISWMPFRVGPLTKLARIIKGKSSFEIQQHYLKDIYHALNSIAGQTLYLNHFDNLFLKAPYLKKYDEEIAKFLVASSKQLYAYKPLSAVFRNADGFNTDSMHFDWIHKAAISERLYHHVNRYPQVSRSQNPQ